MAQKRGDHPEDFIFEGNRCRDERFDALAFEPCRVGESFPLRVAFAPGDDLPGRGDLADNARPDGDGSCRVVPSAGVRARLCG